MRLSVWKIEEDNSMQMSLTTAGQPKGGVFQYELEAATWEEAMAVYHIRMGWEPYKPGCEPEMCPVHKSLDIVYYPEGSGQCWKCELEKTEKMKQSVQEI